jgi:hypothetical protein
MTQINTRGRGGGVKMFQKINTYFLNDPLVKDIFEIPALTVFFFFFLPLIANGVEFAAYPLSPYVKLGYVGPQSQFSASVPIVMI